MEKWPEKWEELHQEGHNAQLMGDFSQAKFCYERALAQKPDFAFAQLALAQLRMMETCFHEGRDLYEARFAAREGKDGFDWRQLPTPRWRGESLGGKHLYLWVEQGFGDVIMYATFLPHLLAQEPKRITLGMFPKMMSLFARSFPNIAVESLEDVVTNSLSPLILDTFPKLAALVEQTGLQIDIEPMRREYELALARGVFDYAAPMGDLLVYGLPSFVPAKHQGHCLSADPQRVDATRDALQHLGQGRRIGISWYTSNSQSGSVRNIPLEQWLPVLATPGCHFISLQHHVEPQVIERFCAENGCTIITDPAFDSIADTEGLAALTACMDEVITIDNSNAHLAGALGVPTTLLLPKGCDFRWPLLEGDHDTLWYRSVKVERQEQSMEWRPVMERVAAAINYRSGME